MATDLPKGAPKVTPKSTGPQNLERGELADTGGDMYDRIRGNYSKKPPAREEDPFAPFDNF